MPLEFVDTHCHLDFNKFDNDRGEVILRAQEAGLSRILIPGITLESSFKAVELAGKNPMVFAAIGIQPNDAISWNENSIHELHQLFLTKSRSSSPEKNKIVAIGEIGLDYFWDASPHEHQKKILLEQMDLASELGLPLVLHLREKSDADHGACADDLLEILTDWIFRLKSKNDPLSEHPGVLHSFSGNIDTANKAIELGFYIGVTGPVTYTNAKKRQELIAAIPLEHLLMETDAPFLTPHPKRGQRNEPANILLVARKVAELHKESLASVAKHTCKNARKLFQW